MWTVSIQESSAVRQVDYEPDTRTMTVYFSTARTGYEFEGVPDSVAEEFVLAESHGRYYNQHIRGKYQQKAA